MQGIAVKEISKFLVQHKSVFFIKYSLYNVPVRVNQSELITNDANECNEKFL